MHSVQLEGGASWAVPTTRATTVTESARAAGSLVCRLRFGNRFAPTVVFVVFVTTVVIVVLLPSGGTGRDHCGQPHVDPRHGPR